MPSHLDPSILHPGKALIAPKPSDDLWACVAQSALDEAEATKRAEQTREDLERAQATLEESAEWQDAQDLSERLKAVKKTVVDADLEVIDLREKAKAAKKLVRKVKAYGVVRALKRDAKTFDEAADLHRKATTRAIRAGKRPTDPASILSSQMGVEVSIVSSRVRENVAGGAAK